MADHGGTLNAGLSSQADGGSRHVIDIGVSASHPVPPTDITPFELTPCLAGTLVFTGTSLVLLPATTYQGAINYGHGINWFERILVKPTVIELGNILSTVTSEIEIYNSFRDDAQTLNTATNNAGTGITFQNLPTLVATIPPQSGAVFQARISSQGQPTIDGTLDFTTSLYALSIAITGSRIVMMAHQPEGDIEELLEFLTDITRSTNGKEQRVRVRNYPRQTFDFHFKFDHEERRFFETFMYKWQPQTFGVPVWSEVKRLTTAVTAGDTTLYFNNDYADFREGGQLIIWRDYLTYDALQIDAVASGSVTVTSEVSRDYPIRTRVMPLRTGITKQEVTGDKYPVNLSEHTIKFHVVDNEVDLASTAAFSTHNGKVMFDDGNWISRGTLTDTMKNVVHHLDNLTGSPIQFSNWLNSHFISSKGFFCKNPQATWQMRQVLHALAGPQKSFYLPTFMPDLVVKSPLTIGSAEMDIEYIRYSDFINGNEPNKSLYIVLTNGTIITRQVLSATIVDATTERLTVDDTWDSTIPAADVERVSFLRLCRFTDDKFEIHHNGSGQAQARFTVWGVLQ